MIIKLVSLLTVIPLMTAAHGAVLLAGWDGTNPGTAGKTGTTFTSSYTQSGVGNQGFAITGGTTGLWGTAALTPASSTGASIFGLVDGATATITMTLINNGTSDISLDFVHANARRDTTFSPTGAAISFVSSTDTDLTAGAGAFLAFGGTGGAYDGYDQSIASVFGGTNVLSAGETVVLAWDFTGSGTENSRLRLDNLAISSAIPEPSTALLSGLAGLALIMRRRR